MRNLDRFSGLVDTINEKIGRSIGYLIIGLTVAIFIEVVMRYIFNSPTIWAWDVSAHFCGIITMFGGGYVLLHGSHVSVDIFVERFPPIARRIIDLILDLLLLLAVGLLVLKGASYAWLSVRINEHYTSLLSPPIYPLKMAIPVGAFLLFLQGLAKFLRDVFSIVNGIGRD